jgi:mRNA interferase HigB
LEYWLDLCIPICYINQVHVLGKNIVDDFKKKHSTSRKALDRWLKLMDGVDFNNPQDIKRMFGGNVDFVGEQIVFDVGGNKVRTITKVSFGIKIVLITHVLTHVEYDKNK